MIRRIRPAIVIYIVFCITNQLLYPKITETKEDALRQIVYADTRGDSHLRPFIKYYLRPKSTARSGFKFSVFSDTMLVEQGKIWGETTPSQRMSLRQLSELEDDKISIEDKIKGWVTVLEKPRDFKALPSRLTQRRPELVDKIREKHPDFAESIDKIWKHFNEFMDGKGPEIMIVDVRKSAAEMVAEILQDLRGFAFPEDLKIILAILPEHNYVEDMASFAYTTHVAVAKMKEMGYENPYNTDALFIRASGFGQRLMPLTVSVGYGGKQFMPNPSGHDFFARTILETFQFYQPGRKGLFERFNDQTVLTAYSDAFSGKMGYIQGGSRIDVSEDLPADSPERNNLFCKTKGSGRITGGEEKPSGDVRRFADENKKAATGLSIRHWSPEAVQFASEKFMAPVKRGEYKGLPLAFAMPIHHNSSFLPGGVSKEKSDFDGYKARELYELYNKKFTKGEELIAREVWNQFITICRSFGRTIGFYHTYIGNERDDTLRYVDTGNADQYCAAFEKLFKDEVFQAFMDIAPDKNGNIIINCDMPPKVEEEIAKHSGLILMNVRLFSIKGIRNGDIILNSIGNIKIESSGLTEPVDRPGRCFICNAYEFDPAKSIEAKREHVTTDLWDPRTTEKIRISYPIKASPKQEYGKKQFGAEEDLSFADLQHVPWRIVRNHASYSKIPLKALKGTMLLVKGTGYAEPDLINQLIFQGYHVVIVDDFSKADINIGHKLGVECVSCDVSVAQEVQHKIMSDFRPAIVVYSKKTLPVDPGVQRKQTMPFQTAA